MLLITCPICGVVGEETEFVCGGEGHIKRLASDADSDENLSEYLFHRDNPKGVHYERWRHVYGCGKWFHLARDTRTMEIYASYGAQEPEPPAEAKAAVEAALRARGLPERSRI